MSETKIILYNDVLIGKLHKKDELSDFLIREIKRIDNLRKNGYYAKFPKWAKLKNDFKVMPKNFLILNSERLAVMDNFIVIEERIGDSEKIIDNFVGYEKIAKINIKYNVSIEIYLNSFEVYENPDDGAIYGRSYVTILKNGKFISNNSKITQMYNHDINYAETKTIFQIVADIITEDLYQEEIKNIEYYNTYIKFFKIWEGSL